MQRAEEVVRTNLAARRTALVGREEDTVAVRDLALRCEGRLVTLTGAGGIGKTSLALEVARGLLHAARFADGVWLAELAPLDDDELLPQMIADAVGLRTPGRATAQKLAA